MIDIVIPSKDRPDFLRKIIPALQMQSVVGDVIVVDNGVDEDTPRICRDLGWKRLSMGRNMSFSESCNRGVRCANGAEFILMNNDAVPEFHAIDSLVGCPLETAITGCLIVQSDDTVNHAGVTLATGYPAHVGRGDDRATWDRLECQQWPATTFACVKIDRSLWDRLGGLDEAYVYGYEDTDFCLRAAELGFTTGVCSAAAVVHDEFGTRRPGDDTANAGRFAATWLADGRAARALQAVARTSE